MQWSTEAISRELSRMEPRGRELGLKTPFARARRLLELETKEGRPLDPEGSNRWESRIRYWREVLGSEEDGAILWAELVDLDRLGDETAHKAGEIREAWADHARMKAELSGLLDETKLQRLLYEEQAWNFYSEEGRFRVDCAEEMLEGRIRILGLGPVTVDPEKDYDWLVSHPRDRLFQNSHQSGFHVMLLGLAYHHQPDSRWAQAFMNRVAALIDQCPRLPAGTNDFGEGDTCDAPSNVAWAHYGYTANRLHTFLPVYLSMAADPAISSRFHEVFLRFVRAQAAHLDDLGDRAYDSNYLSATGKALHFVSHLLPELRESSTWRDRMWPRLIEGARRELLKDGCHFHRSLSYHLTFVDRPLAMLALEKWLPDSSPSPTEFRNLIEAAVDAFISVSTPIRSTPGINDDWTSETAYHELLDVASELFSREDWRWLSTEGESGTPPSRPSRILNQAQLVAMRSGWERDARYLLFNVSPDGGHHHPDPLSIQVWAGGRPLLIDPGVGHYYTGEREISQQSWWHNCPTLGASNLPDDPEPTILHWKMSETEYAAGRIRIQLPGRKTITFVRHLFFNEKRFWVLYDELDGIEPTDSAWENFHFGTADCLADGATIRTNHAEGTNLLLVAADAGGNLSQETACRWTNYGGPGVDTSLFHFEIDGSRTGFAALLVPFEGSQPDGLSEMEIYRETKGKVVLRGIAEGKDFEVNCKLGIEN